MAFSVITWSMLLVFMEVRANQPCSPSYLVARCHGRPDACFCPDPCCNYGRGRRLFGGADVPDICIPCAGCPYLHSLGWRITFTVCCGHCLYAVRYQAGAGLFYAFTDWLYDVSVRCFGLRGRGGPGLHGFDVPPVYPCHVQGIAVSGCRFGYPCHTQ